MLADKNKQDPARDSVVDSPERVKHYVDFAKISGTGVDVNGSHRDVRCALGGRDRRRKICSIVASVNRELHVL